MIDHTDNNGVTDWASWTPDRQEQQILDERARVFGDESAIGSTHRTVLEPFIAIRLGGAGQYGIPYEHLDEILPDADISAVPCVPAHVLGLTTRRGELLTVLDLGVVLGGGGDAAAASGPQQVVVVSSGDTVMGLFVEEVLGYDEYDPQALTPPISSDERVQAGYFTGTWARQTTILSVKALLTNPALVVNDHARPTTEQARTQP